MDELINTCMHEKRNGKYKMVISTAKKIVETAIMNVLNGKTKGRHHPEVVEAIFAATYNLPASRYQNTSFSEAYSLLGKIYETGVLAEKSLKKALMYYKISAEHSNPFGCYRLAHFYENGIACKKQGKKAAYFYKLSANGGCCRGMHRYAMILMEGIYGCKQDVKGAVFYLEQARKLSSPQYPHALYDLGMCYEGSIPIPQHVIKDIPYALEIYQEGDSIGCYRSTLRLGEAYNYGKLGLKMNTQTALAYYTKIGDVSAQACFGIAIIYKQNKNIEEFIKWIKKAAQLGHPDGAKKYADMLDIGEHLQMNKIEAKWWCEIAKSRGAYKK